MNKAEEKICKICAGNSTLAYQGMFDDRYGYPKLFDLYRCSTCQSYITFPPMNMSEIGALYTNFYPRRDINSQTVKERALGWKHESPFTQWLTGEHRIHRSLPKAPQAGIKVLDVGCGDGSSLLELQSLGYEAYGIETDENLKKIKEELKLNIHIGTIENAPYKKGTFDYVIANQVIEHVIDLDGFISHIKEYLAPQGIAVVSTPNAQSIFRALYGRTWIHWHIPYHQQILSIKGLNILFAKHGLNVTGTKTVSPSAWTVHEINRMRFDAKPGVRNPFWTEKSAVQSTILGKIFRRVVFILLSLLGKIADIFNYGNCLIMYMTKE